MKPCQNILFCASLLAGLAGSTLAQSPPTPSTPAPTAAVATNQPATEPPVPAAQPSATNAAPPISSEYGADGLRVNFHGAPLNLVLDYLSDAAGFIINKQTEVRGTVEVWSKQPVTKDEAIELLSSVLKKNGYGMTRSGRILTIVAMDSVKTADTDIEVNSDPSEIEKSDEVQTEIIPVKYATATQLVPNLEVLLPTTASLSANESANTLILVATKTDIKRILKIVTALDNSLASASSIKVRPLRFADAKDTANLITQLFTQQNSNTPGQGGPNFGGPGGGGGPFGGFRAMMAQAAAGGSRGGRNSVAGRVVAVADDRSNSVVVSAPPDLLAAIDEMLDKIDQQVSDSTELRVFHLSNADPSEMADQLAQLFPDDTASNNNNNQNNNVPFIFRGRGGFGLNQANNTQPSDHMKKLGKVLAVPDPRTSSLIVTASKTLMPQIAEMIAELDSDRGKREIVSYFELENADPQDVYQNLQDLFNRSTVRMQNNNNQNTFLGRNNPLTQRETQNQQGTSSTTTSGFGTTGGMTGGRAFGQ